MDERYDVVVVGGGAAGLSGALSLSRARRKVLVIDAGAPRNAPAGHVHNYLGREGTPPAELLAIGRDEVAGYGGQVVAGEVVGAERLDDGFRVDLADGSRVHARRLLVTTGLTDELPDVTGLRELWGSDVLHCPYCHGWEVRDQAIGIIGGPMGVHAGLLWRQWSADVTLFRHTGPEPTEEERAQLSALGVRIVEGEVAAVETTGGRLSGVRMASGEVVAREVVVAPPRMDANSSVLDSLGLRAEEFEMNGTVVGTYIPSEPMGATSVPGVWVAGNVANLQAQVISAAAAGLNAAAHINMDLITEDARLAVAAAQRPHHVHDWEAQYRSHGVPHGGGPNASLVAAATDLPAGSALDVGCGEGADAIWLAARGWRVTAVDVSPTALERAAGRAAAVGVEVDWRRADVAAGLPDVSGYDLVTSHFLHSHGEARQKVFAQLAAAVAPGGTLLLVGHDTSDLAIGAHRSHDPDMCWSAEDVAASLDPAEWEVVVAEARPRDAMPNEGDVVTVHDAVVVARRR
ncbi:bifunctional NAD(P)/FAD-dependent oxidoreductase/class I SAM-dependent methyltransferase [Blastococcus litoris]|uniref:bifunctional NAD(P)/FAD-dependent oxidoreductase/class I SAM-dependent methyltransferase n=1 Tax=Blastococcus litoris TaxID=2171622 RepID=UPI000E303068|nr:bifunctional NAD(P)/FAD-dependent oxidoreductase/class I SAM-dependent methyltransferase [Blastococcus litoris]